MIVQQLLGPNGLIYYVEDENKIINILWGGRIFYSFSRFDTFAKNLGIALLANLGVLQKTICDIFKVKRRTVTRIIKIYQEEGVEGIRNYKKGPQKVEEELVSYVIKKYIHLEGKWGYQNVILKEIEKKVEEGLFVKSISRDKLQNIIKNYKDSIERDKTETETENNTQAMQEKKKKEGLDKQSKDLQLELNERDIQCVQHGGASVVFPFIQEFGIDEFVPCKEDEGNLYNNNELVLSYVALNSAELVKVEQDFKHLSSYQMGGIIGRIKLPSLSLYRNRIPQIVEKMDMEEIILESSKRAHRVFNFSKIVYIDGHFMPYFGKSDILYGYYPQKRLAMHGREYFFVHDEKGIPVYAAISDGYRKMKHYIEKVDEKLREIYGVREKELLEVFDRGGYSKQFCINIADRIRFICWRSDAAAVANIEEDQWTKVIVEHQGNEYGKVEKKEFEAWERCRILEGEGKRAKFREIWIKKGNKVSPALTNDYKRSLQDIVTALTHRWGRQENMFKELKEHGIDLIHSYMKEEYKEDFLYKRGLEEKQEGVNHEIANPKIRELNKEISQLEREIKKISRKIEKEKNQKSEKEIKSSNLKLAGMKRRVTNKKKKRKQLPKKVRLFTRIKEENIVRLCDGKKLFFDWLKMNSIWIKKVIVEIVKPYYKDLRDVNKFVKSVLRSRTYICKRGDQLSISFPQQRSKKMQEVLEVLCSHLNSIKTIDLKLKFKKIIFRVGLKH